MSRVRIRRARAADAASQLELDRRLARDGVGQVRVESDLPDVERVAQQLAEEGLVWVAIAGTAVVGSVSVHRPAPSLLHHVGSLGIGVHPDHQGQGIGTQLMEVAIEGAFAAGVERLELGVRADNPDAVRLYERLGFRHEARRIRLVKKLDGTYVDDLSMVRFAPGCGPDDTLGS